MERGDTREKERESNLKQREIQSSRSTDTTRRREDTGRQMKKYWRSEIGRQNRREWKKVVVAVLIFDVSKFLFFADVCLSYLQCNCTFYKKIYITKYCVAMTPGILSLIVKQLFRNFWTIVLLRCDVRCSYSDDLQVWNCVLINCDGFKLFFTFYLLFIRVFSRVICLVGCFVISWWKKDHTSWVVKMHVTNLFQVLYHKHM